MTKPVLQLIVASTRPGRVGRAVADHIASRLAGSEFFEIEVVDLAEVNLPLFDEPAHPRLQRYVHEHTQQWSATISRGDAYLIVMPEYNYSYSAPLKNALDYLLVEWKDKPVALASYGGVSGGLRAAQAIKLVLQALGMFVVNVAVTVPSVRERIQDGRFVSTDRIDAAIDAVHLELHRVQSATAALRTT